MRMLALNRVAVYFTVFVTVCIPLGTRGQGTCDSSTGSVSLGDGHCDSVFNTPECSYDEGDCCSCTCSGYTCGQNGFDCFDPAAADPLYDCKETPSNASPCPTTDLDKAWIVENATHVRDLAEAARCSGGTFDVKWRGTVDVDETIFIVNGTVLTVTGAGSGAVVHGGGTTRPFTVVNASLHLINVDICNGSSVAGGAVSASGAELIFEKTAFIGNNASFGGALFLSEGSVGAFHSHTSFTENIATSSGGAIYTSKDCILHWRGRSIFTSNVAAAYGGALFAYERSTVSFEKEVSFSNNKGKGGGAMHVAGNASVAMNGGAEFLNNIVNDVGGAVSVSDVGSNVSWSQATSFSGNEAYRGGAIYIHNGACVISIGPTEFELNSASKSGGVVGSGAFGAVDNAEESFLFIRGATTFKNNTAGGNGGGLALLGMLFVEFETANVTFFGNSADVAGGAIFLSGTGVAPIFSDMTFISNSAKVGGAVYAVASGIELTEGNPNPTRFLGCRFVDNKAATTGGAVESSAGRDEFANSSFVGNFAGVGGALRLAGTVTVDSCSFVGNIANEGNGAAVSNVGYIANVTASLFQGNVFSCEAGTFLDFTNSGSLYQTVCLGCPEPCPGCQFSESLRVPRCSPTVEHSSSPGGEVTVEELTIDCGYWRATNTSLNVFTCHNKDACLGGKTGAIDFCDEGYQGPYCAVCSKGYTGSLGFTCSKCSDNTNGIVLAVIVGVVTFVAVISMISYLISGKQDAASLGIVDRFLRFVPVHSIKIVVVAWQILTEFASVANITYPDVYESFLNMVEVLNFNFSWVIKAGCIVDVDFHDRLLISTISPIFALIFLGATYAIAESRQRWSDNAIRTVRRKHASAILLLTFLVYSSVSSVVFQMFSCESLDDGKTYLRADYRIQCDSSKHVALQFYAAAMIVVYPVGIPILYATLLLRNREALQKTEGREDVLRIQSISQLWEPYRPSCYYYEVIECARRVLLSGLAEFINSDSSAQIAITIVIAFGFFGFAEGLSPYKSGWDSWISRSGHVIVFMSLYVALLVDVDVSDENSKNQRVFESILVFANACLILAVVVEAFVLSCSLRAVSFEQPVRKFQSARTSFFTGSSFAEEDDPFASHVKPNDPPVHSITPFSKRMVIRSDGPESSPPEGGTNELYVNPSNTPK